MELNQAFTQRTRLAQAPQPSQIKVDHRSLAQLLALSSDYGHLFKFYSLDNSIDGDWEPMFAADPAIAYATRLGLDTHAVEVRMYEMIDTLIDPRTHSLNLQVIDGLHSLVARMLTILSGRPWTAASAAELYAEAAMLPALTAAATPLASFFNLFPPEKLANPDLISHSGDQLNRLLDLLRSFCGLLVDCLDSAQVDAQQGLSRELNQSGHAPHVALFIAFVMMYQKVQNRLNQFPADLLEFYHQTVLRQAEFSGRLPIPDRVVLTFRPQADIPIASVPVSAEFVAGNDAAGNPIIYTPDLPIDAKNVNLVRLQSLRMFASATANSPHRHSCAPESEPGVNDGLRPAIEQFPRPPQPTPFPCTAAVRSSPAAEPARCVWLWLCQSAIAVARRCSQGHAQLGSVVAGGYLWPCGHDGFNKFAPLAGDIAATELWLCDFRRGGLARPPVHGFASIPAAQLGGGSDLRQPAPGA